MYSPNSHPLRRFFLLVFILFSFLEVYSQCDPPDQLPTVFCLDAPLTCLSDACYSTSDEDNFGWNGWCGDNTAVHNPQYFMVIVTDPDVEIDIHVDACEQGSTALQSALVTNCNWQPCPGNQVPCPDIIDCDPGTGVGGTMQLTASGQTIGDTLWLLIDGSSGSQCQYTIDFASGIYEPLITEEIEEGEATPDVVCQGFDDLLLTAAPMIGNAHGYLWVLGWNNTTITSTLPTTTFDIPNNAPPGMWEICVQAFSGCDTSDIPFCFPLEIVEIDDVEKEPESFCPENFGFDWHGIGIDGPGTYTKTFDNPDGCPYDSIWEVGAYPEVPVGQLEVLHCFNENFDPYEYEGESYYDTGTYPLDYPNQGLNGCDSTAELHLTVVGLDAFIDLTCENGQFVLRPLVQEVVPGNTVIEWEWFEAGGSIVLWDDIPYETLDGGCFELYGTITTAVGSCTFLVGNEPFCFDPEQYWPDPPNMGFTDTIVCAQQGVFFTVIEDPFGEELDYVWTGPADAPLFQDGSGTVEIDFSNSAGGSVCVYAIGACGIGPTFCFNVDIQPTPVASFTFDPSVCNGDMTTVTFNGSAGGNTEVLWNFDNPDFITGSGLGPYTMSWNIDGDKVISLQLIQPGCDTSSYTGTVTVSSLVPPVINCTSTINSITFDWDDVAGSNGYTVSLNGGAPVSTPSSIQVVNGLNPNDMVTMILTVISAGACPNIVDTMTCTAENCPPPMINITGQDSACLNAPAIIDLEVTVNGSPGVGVWSGPGIVDPVLGLFDPKVAGSGQHQIIFATDLMGCAFTEPYLITVFDSLIADFTLDPLICITDLATVTYTGNAPSGANYAYDFGSAVVTSGTGAGPFELSYSTAGTKTVRLQVSDNGCTSDLITHSLDVAASLNQPAVNCQAQTSSVKLCWTPDPLVSAYVVNTLTTHTGVESSNCIDFTGLVPGDSISIEISSQTTGPCPARADTFYCIARQCPPVNINITPVPDICLYPATLPINLEAVVTGGNGVGDWSGPGIIDVVNGKFDPFIAGAGSHLVSYHYLDDGCDFLETTTINVADPPVAFVSNVSFILTCAGGNKLLLDGSGSSGTPLLYEWTTSDGVINTGANSSMAEVIKEGVYQLKVTNSASGCVDSTSVTVSKDANTPNSVAGEDKVLTCDSTSFVLGGGSSVGTNIIYLWNTPDGNIIGPINGQQITVDKVGEYNISVKDTVNGCESTDRALVTIDTSLASLSLNPGDTIDCNTTISGVQSTLDEPVSDYNFLWNTVDGTIVGSNTTPDIDVSQGGLYTLTIENKINGCEKSASATVPESDEIIDGVDVSQMNITCYGYDNGALMINGVIGGVGPYTYSWSVSPQGGTSLTSLSPGTYSLTVTDQNGCTFTEVYDLSEPIKITVDLGPDQVVAGDDTVTIQLVTNINPDAISEIEWSGYDGLSCSGCPSIQFVATSSGNIKALLTDTAGCLASDSMHLKVVVPRIIFIPTVFSPNDDGKNDYFYISGRRNLIGINYLRIYDRWGNQLFENVDFKPGIETEGWDGRYKGQYMLPGVYVYVAELQYEDITESVKGGITILR